MNALRFTLTAASAAALFGLAACGTTPTPAAWTADETLARHASAALRSQAEGALPAAAKQYALALQRARAMDDAEGVALMAYNLAACEFEMGDLDRAKLHLAEIRATAPEFRTPALRLLDARIALGEGRLDDAEAALRTARAEPPFRGSERAVEALLRASIELARGHPAEAARRLDQANGMLAKSPASLRAEAEELRAEIHAKQGASADAAAAWERAANLWSEAQRAGPVAETLAAAAASWADAGNETRALELEYRAARSALANGQPALVRGILEHAMKRPGAGSEPWTSLLAELHGRLPPQPAAGKSAP